MASTRKLSRRPWRRLANQPKHPRKQPKQPKRAKLTEGDLKRVARIVVLMFHCLNSILEPKLRQYIRSIGGPASSDPQKQLQYLLKVKKEKGIGILPGLTTSQIELALRGRNACYHNLQRSIHRNWEDFFTAWIQLATAIGEIKTAKKMRKILRSIK